MTEQTPEPDEPAEYNTEGWRHGQQKDGVEVDDNGIPTNAEYRTAYDDEGNEVGVELVDDDEGAQDDGR